MNTQAKEFVPSFGRWPNLRQEPFKPLAGNHLHHNQQSWQNDARRGGSISMRGRAAQPLFSLHPSQKPILPALHTPTLGSVPSPLKLPGSIVGRNSISPVGSDRTSITPAAFTSQGLPNAKAKIYRVNLPSESEQRENMLWVRVALDFNFVTVEDNSEDDEDPGPEATNREMHFDERQGERSQLPPTIDIFLPSIEGWLDIIDAAMEYRRTLTQTSAMASLPPDHLTLKLTNLINVTGPSPTPSMPSPYLLPTSPFLNSSRQHDLISPISPSTPRLDLSVAKPTMSLNPAAAEVKFTPKALPIEQIPRSAKDLSIQELKRGLGIDSERGDSKAPTISAPSEAEADRDGQGERNLQAAPLVDRPLRRIPSTASRLRVSIDKSIRTQRSSIDSQFSGPRNELTTGRESLSSFTTDIIRNAVGSVNMPLSAAPNDPDNWLQGVEEAEQFGRLESVAAHAHLPSANHEEVRFIHSISSSVDHPRPGRVPIDHVHGSSAASSRLNARAPDFKPSQQPSADIKHEDNDHESQLSEAHKQQRMHSFKFPPPEVCQSKTHPAFKSSSSIGHGTQWSGEDVPEHDTSFRTLGRHTVRPVGLSASFASDERQSLQTTWTNTVTNRMPIPEFKPGPFAEPIVSEGSANVNPPRSSTEAVLRQLSSSDLVQSQRLEHVHRDQSGTLAEFRSMLECGLDKLRAALTEFKDSKSEADRFNKDIILDAFSVKLEEILPAVLADKDERRQALLNDAEICEILARLERPITAQLEQYIFRAQEQMSIAIAKEPTPLLDIDDLTKRLSEAVKPRIQQLIDMAGDKRETAGLVVESLRPLLEARMQRTDSEINQPDLEQQLEVVKRLCAEELPALFQKTLSAQFGDLKQAMTELVASWPLQPTPGVTSSNEEKPLAIMLDNLGADIDLQFSGLKKQSQSHTVYSEKLLELIQSLDQRPLLQTSEKQAQHLRRELEAVQARCSRAEESREESERQRVRSAQEAECLGSRVTQLEARTRNDQNSHAVTLEAKQAQLTEAEAKTKAMDTQLRKLQQEKAVWLAQKADLESRARSEESKMANLLTEIGQQRSMIMHLEEAAKSEKRLRGALEELESDLVELKVDVGKQVQDLQTQLRLATTKADAFDSDKRSLQSQIQLLQMQLLRRTQFDVITGEDEGDFEESEVLNSVPKISLRSSMSSTAPTLNQSTDWKLLDSSVTSAVSMPIRAVIKSDDGWWSF